MTTRYPDVAAGQASVASNADITYAIGTAELGQVLVARTEAGVCAILIHDGEDHA